MLKRLMAGTALSALTLSVALAQAPSTADSPAGKSMTPPAQTQSAPAAPAASGAAATATTDFVATQGSDQWLASKLKGTDVIGSDDKKIGDVSDLLLDKTGKVEAYVISVGGFLGVGSKNVALAPASFQVVPGKNGGADQLKVSMSTDQLKQAQNFEPYSAPKTTTGMSTPGASGMRPSSTPPASK